MTPPKIFCLTGLGANELAFAKLGDLPYEKVLVPWMKNLKGESLYDYAQRLIDKYEIKQQDVLVGLSFGGLVCQYIACQVGTHKLILVSSFRDKNDLSLVFNVGLNTKLYTVLPARRIAILDEIIANFLNSGTPSSKPVIKEMLKVTDYDLMHWSIEQIAQCSRQNLPNTKILSLMGNKDRIMKEWVEEYTILIEGGSHFMVYEKADEVTNCIRSFLKE